MQLNIQKLPIDDLVPELIEAIQQTNSIILQASAGAGKTTRIPAALLPVMKGKILVLEPRRLAARLSAERIATELEEKCGETVGYQIRFEKNESDKTRIKFITEGIFSSLFHSDPYLKEYSCVIIDEFHERHIYSDLALMLVSIVQKYLRNDLKLIVMSATLETQSLQTYLPEAKLFSFYGQVFPVKIEYLQAYEQNKPLHIQVLLSVEYLVKNSQCPGHILVFLPGSFEIRLCAETLANSPDLKNCLIYQLRADISFQEQQVIFGVSQKRKIILSTNVAETSITIDGITGVIDSGLAKIAGYASWSGLPTLDIAQVSQASCIQRAGRAGRTSSGIAKRLFTEHDFNSRAKFSKPEILRSDLTQTLLELKLIEQTVSEFQKEIFGNNIYPWFESPLPSMVNSCTTVLSYLNAVDEKNNINETGMRIVKYSLHPRLAKVLVEAENMGLLAEFIFVVALMNEGFLFKKGIESVDVAHSDVEYQLEIFKNILAKKEISTSLKNKIDFSAVNRAQNVAKQLAGLKRIYFNNCFKTPSCDDLSTVLLAAFPDRVCQNRAFKSNKKFGKAELNLCMGGGAVLSQSSVVQDSEFLIALEAEESAKAISQAYSSQVRICHGVEIEQLYLQENSFLQEIEEYVWDEQTQKVRGSSKTLYGKLVLEEQYLKKQSSKHQELLKKKFAASWPFPFENCEYLNCLKVRIKLAQEINAKINTPNFIEDIEILQNYICEGKSSFAEILEKSLELYIDELLPTETKVFVDDFFPRFISIGKKKKIQIHYEDGKTPWVESNIQDFFGTLKTPSICKNSIVLVVHLLAPNKQAVQVTTDLSGFWERGYKDVIKEYKRRYPRHYWPDDPSVAEPPEFINRRKRI